MIGALILEEKKPCRNWNLESIPQTTSLEITSIIKLNKHTKMLNNSQNIHPFFFILVATILEVSGDAIIRTSLYNHTGIARVGLILIGAILLLGYGTSINLAPVEFGEVVGLYIATLFIVWQIINFIAFRSVPTIPIIVGGTFIVVGGLIVSFWQK